jgi:hypothetical protein
MNFPPRSKAASPAAKCSSTVFVSTLGFIIGPGVVANSAHLGPSKRMTHSPAYMRAWHADHPGKATQYSRNYRHANREKASQCQRDYRKKNHAKLKAYRKAYYLRNRTKCIAAVRRFESNNPGYKSAIDRKSRDRLPDHYVSRFLRRKGVDVTPESLTAIRVRISARRSAKAFQLFAASHELIKLR